MIDDNRTRLIWRFVATATTSQAAETVKQAIATALSPVCCEMAVRNMQPYWKIDGTYEIVLDTFVDKRLYAFREILDVLGKGWEVHETDTDSWAVWNSNDRSTFCCEAVKWANVECIHECQTEDLKPDHN